MRILVPFQILAMATTATAQTTHLLRAQDFFYLPDTVTMLAGDSLKFQTQGAHNIMQVDQASWLTNQPTSNGGFLTVIGVDSTFAIDTAGTYYFVCEPHGFMGMKGVLLVAPNGPTATQPGFRNSALFRVYPDPASDVLYIELENVQNPVDAVELIDPLGRAHSIRCSSTAKGFECGVRDLPRGHGVLCVHMGPSVLLRPLVLD